MSEKHTSDSTRNSQKAVTSPKKSGRSTRKDQLDEESATAKVEIKSSDKKRSTSKTGDIDYLFTTNIDTGFVTNDLKKYVFKIIHENTARLFLIKMKIKLTPKKN
jgi:hypothetical protein